MCELYCPEDGLYAPPDTDATQHVNASELAACGVFGSYRATIGWSATALERRGADLSYRLLPRTWFHVIR